MRPLQETSYRNYLSFMDQLGLVDVYRVLQPKKKVFTWYINTRDNISYSNTEKRVEKSTLSGRIVFDHIRGVWISRVFDITSQSKKT